MIMISLALRVPASEYDEFRPSIEALVKASRAEPGVIAYYFAKDILDPSLIRIVEIYEDNAALDRHLTSDHYQAWRPGSRAFVREDYRRFDATPHST